MQTLIGLVLAGATLLASTAMAAEPDAARVLAPSGTLRAAINFGNPVLAQRDKATGEPRGISVALAHELGQRLGVPVRYVAYEEAGLVAAAAVQDAWDLAFLAVDPTRGTTIEFTEPYVLIEGTYVVPPGSKLNSIEAVDQPGVRICVTTNSAYDLFLSRTLKHAELSRFANGGEAEAARERRDVPDAWAAVHRAAGRGDPDLGRVAVPARVEPGAAGGALLDDGGEDVLILGVSRTIIALRAG